MAGPDEAGLAHQPGDALAGMPLALLAQVGVTTRRAVGLPRAEMDGAAALQPGGLRHGVRRGLPAGPGVVPGLRHAERARHGSDREVGLIGAHEPEDPDGRTPVSRANHRPSADPSAEQRPPKAVSVHADGGNRGRVARRSAPDTAGVGAPRAVGGGHRLERLRWSYHASPRACGEPDDQRQLATGRAAAEGR